MDRYKVMIVDDEMPAREMLKAIVDWEQTRFEIVHEAVNGKEALDIALNQDVDLIITDIQMPVMDGLGLLRALEEKAFTGEVVVLSCHEEFRFAREAMRYGVKEYLIKDLLSEADLLEMLSATELELIKKNAVPKNNERDILFRREALRKLVITPQSFDELLLSGFTMHSYFNLTQENYTLFVVWMDGYVAQYEKLTIEQKRLQVRNSMDALTRAADAFGGEVFYNRKGEFILLLSTPKTASGMDYFKNSQERCAYIRQKLKAVGSAAVTIGVSNQFSDLSNANERYMEAKNACKYRVFLGGGRNIFFNTPFAQMHKAAPDQIEDRLQKVFGAIHSGNKRQLLSNLKELYSNDFRGFMQYNYLRYVNGRLISEMLKHMAESMHSSEDILGMPYIPLNYLDSMETTQQMYEFWERIAEKIYDDQVLDDAQASTYGVKVSQAISMLKDQYKTGIGLQELAESLGVHKVYLSRVFKEETGVTVSHYIQSLKMEDAKRFLRDTEMKVYDIAEALGYSQSQQFSVAFKKMTGETPHTYRKRIQENLS